MAPETLGRPHRRASESPASALQHELSRNATTFISPAKIEVFDIGDGEADHVRSRAPTSVAPVETDVLELAGIALGSFATE